MKKTSKNLLDYNQKHIDNNGEDKKAKDTKKCIIKKVKFQDHKSCLKAAQVENRINHLWKNNIDVEYQTEFIKNNKLVSKMQQRFKNKKHNVFTEEINKIALSLNDDRRTDSTNQLIW